MKLEQCPSTDDEIMCTYVPVPSKKSCKIYLCVYNKINEKEICVQSYQKDAFDGIAQNKVIGM